jgi:hypothetical protein
MKTIITSIFLFICILVKGQTSDVMYVPDQKTLVVTYNNNSNGIGFYAGGYLVSTFPAPFIYTTPMSRFNRVGLSVTNNKVALMGGIFAESYYDSVSVKPDIWFKIFPLRIITKTNDGPDLTLGLNYMNGFRYGVGLSIPFRGIY